MAVSDSVDPDARRVASDDPAGRIVHDEPRRTATAYVRGLPADIDRENC
ncbi:hypothetical protein GCM10010517_42280 [Streptosporangium fragile]|uniref:Uncharacterized protein n=1 Tax=Streptosporangium fragile TaxID=46186 RepID=A0ABN3W0Q5_9ACTN